MSRILIACLVFATIQLIAPPTPLMARQGPQPAQQTPAV